mmetsp:Transcript_16800/g.47376  ORF Transcript_16800/g.47376 Transcript_16800/m.47376 type:complete len:358 (+) Transcript_16800:2-1075(+)
MRVMGGSLTSALALTFLAWGIRALRGAHLRRQLPGARGGAGAPGARLASALARNPNSKRLAKAAAPLSSAAVRLLLELDPVPHLVVDVRSREEVQSRPLPGGSGPAGRVVHLPEDALHSALALRPRQWPAELPQPPPRRADLLVFVSSCPRQTRRCAAYAASLGYGRACYLDAPLEELGAEAAGGAPAAEGGGCRFLNRDAVALLMGHTQGGKHPRAALLDLRRHDERAMFGAIEGSVHLPVDQLPKALQLGLREWERTYRFPKPGVEEGSVTILQCRTNKRARWAAQLCAEAGWRGVYVYRQGVYGWHLSEDVKQYASYDEGAPLPQPEAFDVEAVDEAQARKELVDLGLASLLPQ